MARASAGKQISRSAARGRASGRTADAPWGPTEMQRDYRTLLDRAKDTPQEVLDSDGELLVIQTKGVADFQRRLQAQVAETARFLAIYNEHREVPPPEWAMQTGYPWLAASLASGELGVTGAPGPGTKQPVSLAVTVPPEPLTVDWRVSWRGRARVRRTRMGGRAGCRLSV